MKTTIKKITEVERQWYILDAKDKTLGRIATVIADKIRGKDKPIFSPHADYGDFVIVINADKVRLSGKKMSDKIYYTHSGYLGHLKEEKAENLLVRKPTRVLELAVSGMLPKNKLRAKFMEKLKLYAGESHPHEAQQPKNLELK